MAFENRVKRMLKEGKRTAGAWAQLASPFTAEILAQAGFDWLIIDMEHGPGDILTLVSQLQAMKGTDAVALVRAPWNDFVAIKRILPSLAENKKFVAMFLDEARVAAMLSHANIVQTFDVGESDNSFFIVMEFVDGASLKGIIDYREERNRTKRVERLLASPDRGHGAGP